MSQLKLPTLLAVTDNPSVRFWIKKQLDEDFFIVDASKKHAAITSAQTTSFDFIIVDSEFEDCDALELCSELKQILRTLTPILLITGRLKRSYLTAAKKAGVTDFLNNQLDPEELKSRVAAIRKGYSLREKTQDASNALAQKLKAQSFPQLKHRVMPHNQALKVLKEAKKEGVPISSLIIQIDRFNELQNKIGSLISDQIIAPLKNLIQHSLSKTDFLIPSAEDQFLIILKNTTPENGRILAERIRKEILKTPFQTETGPVKLTVSITVSSLEGTTSDFNQMVKSSLKALEKAQDQIIPIEKEKHP